ncbi:MAG: elongation factor G [Christensenellaceae bacterium]
MSILAKDIRNIAIVGHSGEGKTTLAEAMLFNGGAIDRMGKVTDGTTVMDFDEIEKTRKISVSTGLSYLIWKGVKINLLDAPGFYDFEGERKEALRAAGGALLVIGANGIIPIGTEAIVESCLKIGKPLIIFINGMDKENADYLGTIRVLKERFQGKLAPIQIPIMGGEKMTGYVNALQDKAYRFSTQGPQEIPIPENMVQSTEEMQYSLMETAAENDETLLEKYFEEAHLTREETIYGIRKGIAKGNTIPVMAGSALLNRGVINLLDEIVRYMPTAHERAGALATDLEADEIVSVTCEENGPFAAHVFKTVIDPFSGKLHYLKVFRGNLRSGMTLLNTVTGQEERIGQIYLIRGKKTELVSELNAGDIGAVNKLSNTNTNDTLCDPAAKVVFDPISFSKPTLSMAVTPVKKGDEDKMYQGFLRMAEEDPTFTVGKSADTGEFLLNGQGEIQLELMAKRLQLRYGVAVTLTEPKISYRETIRSVATAEGKHKKQSGGHGQYGHCKVRFEPCEEEFIFDEEVVGGSVPKQYIPAVEKGLRECLSKGPLAGYPVTGVKAVLYDGSYHEVDSSEMAFKAAAAIAFREGLKNATPVLLEPIMKMKISVPNDYLGDVMGDLNKRRGRILNTHMDSTSSIVIAEAPLAEITKYTTELRGFTQGKGKFSTEFARYEDVPAFLAEKIIANAQQE